MNVTVFHTRPIALPDEAAKPQSRLTAKAIWEEPMARSAKFTMAVIGAIAILQVPAAARADRYPFRFTWGGGEKLYLVCNGPLFRTSGCVPIGPGSYGHHEFYYAEDGLGGPTGKWGCNISRGDSLCLSNFQAPVDFCLGEKGQPTTVELEYADGRLSVNQSKKGCGLALATSILGQNGEDDASPAQDLDTYSFAGKPGEKVAVSLDRDGSGGSIGEVATLRVSAPNGAVLAQRTGAVPLSLDVTLPGKVEIAVSRQPGKGAPLRGYYDLQVTPASGNIGERVLTPTTNVED